MLTDQAKSLKRINRILREEYSIFPCTNPIDIDLDVIGWLAEYQGVIA